MTARYGRSAFKPKRRFPLFPSFPLCSLLSILLFPALCLFPFFLPAFFSFLSAFSLFFLSFCCFRRIKNAFAAAVKVIRNRKQKRFLWTWYMCDTPSEKTIVPKCCGKSFCRLCRRNFPKNWRSAAKNERKQLTGRLFVWQKNSEMF